MKISEVELQSFQTHYQLNLNKSNDTNENVPEGNDEAADGVFIVMLQSDF